MTRLAIARLWHEGNSFSPVPTEMEDFLASEWVAGKAAREVYGDTETEIGGALDFLSAHPGWEAVFLRQAAAMPSGLMRREVFEQVCAEITGGLKDGGFDAVYLSLHGALVVEELPLADLELIRRVRQAIGPEAKLAASFDLHANMHPEIASLIDIGTAYRTHPHVDMRSTGRRAVDLLREAVEGRIRPVGRIAKLNAILPSINMRTATGPMAEMEAAARAAEALPGVLDCSIFGGFSYGDTPSAGGSVMVFADADAALAESTAASLLREYEARRDAFFISLPSAAEGLRQALSGGPLPTAIVDAGDNPYSGGIGDTPELIRAVLDCQPQLPTVVAFYCDPGLVQRAQTAGSGAPLSGHFGARLTRDYGAPVPFSGTVDLLTNGRFRNRGPVLGGMMVELGPTAVIRIGQVRVIVTSRCVSPSDPGFFDLHRVDVTQPGLLCVKAKNHFRAAFSSLLPRMIDVDAPGPAALEIRSFRFRHAPAGIYPLSDAA
ncbi:M81 family metallopeptidase [Roseomonas marmotae]|uniref:Microcystinase C n=1 Tax=Roseomonas marmotae TaxID=2768161 RepID=A0ABS3K8K1_9PROT|nr:M81 family metallopeptidase [Roseomonas marmotae]MBO1073789.1 M81 family metallopeptidase [Roseomonas marmotae]QTI78581.1 M81 family metallopeptidase [Roseomonas marmotae]